MRESLKGESLGRILEDSGFNWEKGSAVLSLLRYVDDDPIEGKVILDRDHELLRLKSQHPRGGIFHGGTIWGECFFLGRDDRQLFLTKHTCAPGRPWELLSVHLDLHKYLDNFEAMPVANF